METKKNIIYCYLISLGRLRDMSVCRPIPRLQNMAYIAGACGCSGWRSIKGVLVLLNTVGGDVEAGLAIAEMLASISKPVVTLVLGGSHSIGVPLAVSGNVSFIVPTATMVVHPLRVSDTVLGVRQNYEYIERMQDRIIQFTSCHSKSVKIH